MTNSIKFPKNPLKLTLTSMQSMQEKAGQNTFGGRFGGRKSAPETKLKHLRRPNFHFRLPNPFGGKFRRPKGTPEMKVSNLRRHLRRPNFPPEPKVQKLGGKLGQPKPPPHTSSGVRRPNVPSAAEPEFISRAETCPASRQMYQTPLQLHTTLP